MIVSALSTLYQMSLKGSFSKVLSSSTGIMIYSFSLKNTSLLSSVTVDCIISDAAGHMSQYYRGIKIGAQSEYVFNRDTCNWDWCDGDFLGILNRKDKITDRWVLTLKQYPAGSCPECHGSKKCKQCKGQGYSLDADYSIKQCPYCGGTGVCQTCYVPIRSASKASYGASPSIPVGSGSAAKRGRPAIQIQMDISHVQSQLAQVEWDIKMMELKGTNTSSFVLYNSQLQLRYTYQQRLAQLQQELLNAL